MSLCFGFFLWGSLIGMRTLDEVIAARSPESQRRITELADVLILETGLQMILEELQLSQRHVAEAMGGKLSWMLSCHPVSALHFIFKLKSGHHCCGLFIPRAIKQ